MMVTDERFLERKTVIPDRKPGHSEGARPVVLLVDDDCTVRSLLATSLRHLGCRVLAAGNGKEALRILHTQTSVDVVVTEATMPVMHGLELLRIVRQTHGLRHLGIILCAAALDETTKRSAAKYGCSSYLSKPVHPEFLFDQISGLLHHEDAHPDLQPAQL